MNGRVFSNPLGFSTTQCLGLIIDIAINAYLANLSAWLRLRSPDVFATLY
jgi:hypothetical protein